MLMTKFGKTVISDMSYQVGYFHRIPEPWHWFQAGYIRPSADISDVTDISDIQSGSRPLALAPDRISDLQSGSRTVAAGSGRIYLTSHRIYPTQPNQQNWIQNLRAKTQRFEDPMCFEAWKLSRRHQGAKMEEIHA
jgi:hypothetical protein